MKKHILLVDNDKHELDYFLDALKEVPEEDGFKCTYVNSAIEAAELLKTLVPHFIFIDKAFHPGEIMNILQSIKEEMRLCEVKIFLYTTTHEEPEKLFSSYGVKGCVKKARSSDKLSKRLTTCLSA